jgi:hypothetical protein
MTAKEEGKPGGGCSPCCSNGGAPDLSPVLKSVKPLYGPERMRPMAGMVWFVMYTTADQSNGQTVADFIDIVFHIERKIKYFIFFFIYSYRPAIPCTVA